MPRVAHTNLTACEPSGLRLPCNFGGYNFLSAFAQLHNSRGANNFSNCNSGNKVKTTSSGTCNTTTELSTPRLPAD